jgi:outer membrane PBP1 activator LpoA protein
LRAMGIDSFRLYPRLKQMITKQIDSLMGTTGILRMADNQRIHRVLEVAEFVDGLAKIRE